MLLPLPVLCICQEVEAGGTEQRADGARASVKLPFVRDHDAGRLVVR